MKQTMNETKPSGWQRRTILFLTSQCITLFGSTLVQMAVVWYATMETGKPSKNLDETPSPLLWISPQTAI